MPVTQQDEITFARRLRSIERRAPRRRGARRSLLSGLPFNLLWVTAALVLSVKLLMLNAVPLSAYQAAAAEVAAEGPLGPALAMVFGPDPVSTEIARVLKF